MDQKENVTDKIKNKETIILTFLTNKKIDKKRGG